MTARKPKPLYLTRTELEHILTTVVDERDAGAYWGRKDRYLKRAKSILAKISKALEEDNERPA